MPKETFLKLPPEKKKAIFDAAVAEFSENSFSNASINKIVKEAGIPRGSFYQYFEDKEDVYVYVLTEIGKEKLSYVNSITVPDGIGFVEHMMLISRQAFEWAEKQPSYFKIGMLMEYDNSQCVAMLKRMSKESVGQLDALMDNDIRLGIIRSDVDLDVVMDIIIAFQSSALKEFYETGNKDAYLAKLEAMLKIIMGGISNAKG